jgi:hypothetical protein
MATFIISLQIHHVSKDLHYLTQALATKPTFCLTAGQQIGPILRKSSVWDAKLSQGSEQQFEQALEALLAFVKQHEAILADFAGDDGKLEVFFTFTISAKAAREGEIAHYVNLHPFLLYELSSRQIGVKVQLYAET